MLTAEASAYWSRPVNVNISLPVAVTLSGIVGVDQLVAVTRPVTGFLIQLHRRKVAAER
jgi:hypothetical protein